MGSMINQERGFHYKVIDLAVAYLTRGVPNSLLNEQDQSKATISPLMIPGANV